MKQIFCMFFILMLFASATPVSDAGQSIMILIFRVADFSAWLPTYEARDSVRRVSGLHNYIVGRGVNDTSMVIIEMKSDDIGKAKLFAANPALKQAMKNGGVISGPYVGFFIITTTDPDLIRHDIRELKIFNVLNWQAWQSVRNKSKIACSYGHDAEDNHKVLVISASDGTGTANDSWQTSSDTLKATPEHFIYRVVKRY
jgi:hypothetical protein